MSDPKSQPETNDEFIERLVAQYGEPRRRLIMDVLKWLDERDPIWELEGPVDREQFIKDLMVRNKIP
jgi:hypothetical protein